MTQPTDASGGEPTPTATRADLTEAEWAALQKGITGSAMLVSLADRDFTDSFGEVGALAKYLQGQQVAGASSLVRELAKTHGTGFGLGTSPETMRTETIEALNASLETLRAKAPDEVDGYRQLVLGACQAVAEAKGGVTPVEATMLEQIQAALSA
jgi:tellurite resistance protein